MPLLQESEETTHKEIYTWMAREIVFTLTNKYKQEISLKSSKIRIINERGCEDSV